MLDNIPVMQGLLFGGALFIAFQLGRFQGHVECIDLVEDLDD
jgi:hypothetical protein